MIATPLMTEPKQRHHRHGAHVAGPRDRAEGAERREGLRLLPRLAVGAAQPELAERVEVMLARR